MLEGLCINWPFPNIFIIFFWETSVRIPQNIKQFAFKGSQSKRGINPEMWQETGKII